MNIKLNIDIPQIDEEISDDLLKSTIQIFKHTVDGVKPLGSGILFSFEDNYFILTAAHNLKGLKRQDLSVRIGNSLISLEHDILHYISETGENKDDKIDLGAILIRTNDAIQDINTFNRCINLEDINFNPVQQKSTSIQTTNPDYIMFGYPESQTKLKHGSSDHWKVKVLYFKCGLNNIDTSEIIDLGFRNHIFCTRTKGGSDLYTGQKRNLPLLYGMSGCGLWQLNKIDVNTGRFQLKLCGIFYGVEKEFLIFTKVGHVIDMIRESFNLKKLPCLGYNLNWNKKLHTL